MPSPLVKHQEIVAGDDYKAAENRALTWGPSQYWPDLASATLDMIIGHMQFNLYGNLPVHFTGTVPPSPDSPTTVSMDVAGIQSENMPQDEYDYILHATLGNGDRIPIAQGKLTVLADPGSIPLFTPAE